MTGGKRWVRRKQIRRAENTSAKQKEKMKNYTMKVSYWFGPRFSRRRGGLVADAHFRGTSQRRATADRQIRPDRHGGNGSRATDGLPAVQR